jgi:hypothetical protein
MLVKFVGKFTYVLWCFHNFSSELILNQVETRNGKAD